MTSVLQLQHMVDRALQILLAAALLLGVALCLLGIPTACLVLLAEAPREGDASAWLVWGVAAYVVADVVAIDMLVRHPTRKLFWALAAVASATPWIAVWVRSA